MPSRFRLSLTLLALASAAPAAGQSPAPGTTPRWIVNTEGDTCTMSRALPGSPAIDFAVRTSPGTDRYDLLILAEGWPRELRNAANVRLVLPPATARYQNADVGQVRGEQGTRRAIRFGYLPREFLRDFGAAARFSLAAGEETILTYDLPQAASVARVFADCERIKLVEWGADPAGFGPGTQRPRAVGEMRDWIDLDDIPGVSRRSPMSFSTRLALGTDGRPTNCLIVASSLAERGRAAVCAALMRNARYEPARDARGNPVRSLVTLGAGVRVEEVVTTGRINVN